MRKLLVAVVLVLLFSGCDSFRFAPGEVQKANAWLHNRTAQMTADAAKDEGASSELVAIAALSELQSRAFVADYGMPGEFPAAATVDDVLSGSAEAIAMSAVSLSSDRPNVWDMADGLIEIGVAIAGVLGGVYGIRATQFLRRAGEKSKALREIIEGNELFKRQNTEAAEPFKQAHKTPSPTTRQLVTQLKNG